MYTIVIFVNGFRSISVEFSKIVGASELLYLVGLFAVRFCVVFVTDESFVVLSSIYLHVTILLKTNCCIYRKKFTYSLICARRFACKNSVSDFIFWSSRNFTIRSASMLVPPILELAISRWRKYCLNRS